MIDSFEEPTRVKFVDRAPSAVIALVAPAAGGEARWTCEWLAIPDLRRYRELEAVVRLVLGRADRLPAPPRWEVVASALHEAWELHRATTTHRALPRLEVERLGA